MIWHSFMKGDGVFTIQTMFRHVQFIIINIYEDVICNAHFLLQFMNGIYNNVARELTNNYIILLITVIISLSEMTWNICLAYISHTYINISINTENPLLYTQNKQINFSMYHSTIQYD